MQVGPGRLNTPEKLFLQPSLLLILRNSQVIATPEEIKILYPVSLPSLAPPPPFYKTKPQQPSHYHSYLPIFRAHGPGVEQKVFCPHFAAGEAEAQKGQKSFFSSESRFQYFFESCWNKWMHESFRSPHQPLSFQEGEYGLYFSSSSWNVAWRLVSEFHTHLSGRVCHTVQSLGERIRFSSLGSTPGCVLS